VPRIMIADDRESMRSVCSYFGPVGLFVVKQRPRKKRLRKPPNCRPDLIVLDYKLQTSDGIAAADGILRVMPTVPIAMFTLYKTDELALEAKRIGIRCVVGKEDGIESLFCAIDSELNSCVNLGKFGFPHRG
jgi:DNA-binding NarL/FixJ family response regulator